MQWLIEPREYCNLPNTISTIVHSLQADSGKHLSLLLVEGPSGSAKTRLVRYTVDEILASGREVQVAYARATRSPGLSSLLQMLADSVADSDFVRSILQTHKTPAPDIAVDFSVLEHLSLVSTWSSKASLSTRGRLHSHESRLLLHEEPTFQYVAESRHASVSSVLSYALVEIARYQSIILIIDDLDLADITSLEALYYEIIPALLESSALIILAYSLEEVATTHPVRDFLKNVEQRFHPYRESIAPLSSSAIRNLVELSLPETTMVDPSQAAERIRQITSGVLASVRDTFEWLRSLPKDRRMHLIENPELIPDYEAILDASLRDMPEEVSVFARTASVQGRYFSSEVVGRILQYPAELSRICADTLRSQPFEWIRIDAGSGQVGLGDEWYQFRGTRRASHLYSKLSKAELESLHAQTADMLIDIYGEKESRIQAFVAHHYRLSHAFSKSARFSTLSAHSASQRGDFISASRLARSAIEDLTISGLLDSVDHCRSLVELGRAELRQNRGWSALRALESAYAMASSLSIDDELDRELRSLFSECLLNCGRYDLGIPLAQGSVYRLLEAREFESVADLMNMLEVAYFVRADVGFADVAHSVLTKINEDKSEEASELRIRTLQGLSRFHWKRGGRDDYLSLLNNAITELNSIWTPSLRAELEAELRLLFATMTMNRLDLMPAAVEAAEQSVRLAEKTHKRLLRITSRKILAEAFESSNQFEAARFQFQQALELASGFTYLGVLGNIESRYGEFLSHRGNRREALKWYESAAEHHLSTNQLEDRRGALNNVAAIHKFLGDFERSRLLFEQLLGESLSNRDHSRESLTCNHLGDIYRVMNLSSESELMHRRAQRLSTQLGNTSRVCISLRYLGQCLLARRDWEAADECFSTASKLYSQQKYSGTQTFRLQVSVGRLNTAQGDFDNAWRHFSRAEKGLHKAEYKHWQGVCALNQAIVSLLTGKADDALQYTQSAMEAFRYSESWKIAEAYHFLGRCFVAFGNNDLAADNFRNAKKVFMSKHLFHRVYQVEISENLLSNPTSQFTIAELNGPFVHTGV